MAPEEAASGIEHEDEEDEVEEERTEEAYNPSAPSSELFDVSTTVDPSYIISLIRKLLPFNVRDNHRDHGVNGRVGSVEEGSEAVIVEESTAVIASPSVQTFSNNRTDVMDIPDDHDGLSCRNEGGQILLDSSEHRELSAQEQAWEEYGCILWDLAANKTHSEFMVENLLLDVLLASLAVAKSVRVIEISLGILANLVCHEVPRNHIISTKGLVSIVVDQLFLDDSTCLCEACRLLTLGLRSSESVTWAEALQHEHVLLRILWIAENTLNPQLLEKSVGLLLAMVDNQHEVTELVLPPLMKLGLANILINLLACEVDRLYGDRIPDRYPALDVILEVIEVLSAVDNYSKVIALNKELLKLVLDVVKLPDKVEISSSCVAAVVLFANILADAPDLVSEVSQDVPFLQGLLDTIPYVSDDSEARHALWSVVGRLLLNVQEHMITPSLLNQYVSALVDKSDFIEEDLVDHKQEDLDEDHMSSKAFDIKRNARITAVS
ncbi:hypothetical protein BVC80_1835g291 [Macleaya cordata]|uniref:Armadillo-like helical n=1 Tax=Macleaya cordata TaxID=56857 RepID=A0A200R5B4_MACCD|nr:hypothetical protein BVC80_1835g291 [Macleaya cordata]